MMKFQILTNNPRVRERLGNIYDIQYKDISYKEVLLEVRSKVQSGYQLLSHPLSGSVKPNETPYKSVMISGTAQPSVDTESEIIIENCIMACEKFPDMHRYCTPEILEDFQLIDYNLIDSAISSATTV